MRLFDQIDPLNVDRRQWELWMLAVTVIIIMAVGMALLMYPAALSNDLIVSGGTKRKMFFGFCALLVLLVGYLLDRQIVINQLRGRITEERRRTAAIRQEASVDLLATLPGFDFFRDRLTMAQRRAATAHSPLSLLVVKLDPSPQLPAEDKFDTVIGDAAKALIRKLRAEDSLYYFRPYVFAVVLPEAAADYACQISKQLSDGLRDAAGASLRFLFDVRLINYPDHARTAREMEEAARSFFTTRPFETLNLEAA